MTALDIRVGARKRFFNHADAIQVSRSYRHDSEQRRLWFRAADFDSSTKGCADHGDHGVIGSIVRRKEMEGAKKYSPPSIFTYPEK